MNTREIYEGEAKKELEAQLVEEMHGVQRVPATDLYKWIAHSLCTCSSKHFEATPPSYYSLSSIVCGFGSSRKTIEKV